MAFLIEVVKGLVKFIAICIGLAVMYLIYIIVREVGWQVKEISRKQKEDGEEDKAEEK